MKLLRIGQRGNERPAILDADGVTRDVSDHIEDFTPTFFGSGGLELLRDVMVRGDVPAVTAAERVGPPITRPPKIICVGLNYAEHAREAGVALPKEPVLFAKAANTVVGPHDDVRLPRGGVKTDWEVELGVVIGQEARYLPDESAAREAIAGYVLSHDVSERSFQLERGGQWIKGKSAETFNPLGPYLVTPEEVPEPQSLDLWSRVNGEICQSSTSADMIFSVDQLVWYVSQFMVLEPGDLLNTGTPQGVGMGMDPPRYLQAGDIVELGISGLGTQRQRVVGPDDLQNAS